jgi:hypothetical protein
VRRHIKEINAIYADEARLRLDEDGEAILIPSVVVLTLLCEHCHTVLPRNLDVMAWKARYLAMFDEQIDGLGPVPGHKEKRRAVIVATFDQLIQHHHRVWQRE